MPAEISIIVPIYNNESYLPQCIDSIIKQDFKDIEVILIDDGSTDRSGIIADDYANKDSRIKVIHKQNGGLVSARKTGVMNATGKYITFVDSDDFIESDIYSKMYKQASENFADIVVCACSKDDRNGNISKIDNNIETGIYSGEKLPYVQNCMMSYGEFFSFGILPSLCLKLFQRDMLTRFQMLVSEEITMGEDAAVSFPVLLNAKRIVVDNSICGYHYCVVDGSMTRRFECDYFKKISLLYVHLKNNLSVSSGALMNQLERYRLYLLQIGMEMVRNNSRMSFSDKKKYYKEINELVIFENIEITDMSFISNRERNRLLFIYREEWIKLRFSYFIQNVQWIIKNIF